MWPVNNAEAAQQMHDGLDSRGMKMSFNKVFLHALGLFLSMFFVNIHLYLQSMLNAIKTINTAENYLEMTNGLSPVRNISLESILNHTQALLWTRTSLPTRFRCTSC